MEPSTPDQDRRESRGPRASIAELVSAGLLRPGQELYYRKNEALKATVTADGTLEFKGKQYKAPSKAARAAAKGTPTSGWRVWFIKDRDRWISLSSLRSEFFGVG